MSKTLFEHTFANGTRVDVTDGGVTVWDAKASRWIIDASCIVEDGEFHVAGEITDRMTREYSGSWGIFPAFYTKRTSRKPKRKVRRKARGV